MPFQQQQNSICSFYLWQLILGLNQLNDLGNLANIILIVSSLIGQRVTRLLLHLLMLDILFRLVRQAWSSILKNKSFEIDSTFSLMQYRQNKNCARY
jgi:hypothetical protein